VRGDTQAFRELAPELSAEHKNRILLCDLLQVGENGFLTVIKEAMLTDIVTYDNTTIPFTAHIMLSNFKYI